ncbi:MULTISPECIES: class I SAM-dependent methyltransferase [Aphanothece]|uniref:class I SAM-dependent methyltransferase n=1 Tax=Aphanothece TaxID=1121 RepID=UPI003984DE82
MDTAWKICGCDQQHYAPALYRDFYSHPVWLLNGIYVEQDPVSMGHRRSIANGVASLGPRQILDFGGGFGTLARLIADRLPCSHVSICDPFPPAHGLEACKAYPNITFVHTLTSHRFDALVCTDVLEHVHDPISLLEEMIVAVKPGGHLFIANCFQPVILCHLPCTFHLRYFFSWCAEPLGLQQIGRCQGSHAWIYQRRSDGAINRRKARFRETVAKALHPLLNGLAIPARPLLRGIRALLRIGAVS